MLWTASSLFRAGPPVCHAVRPFPLETPCAEITWQLDRYLNHLPQDSLKRLAVDATAAGDPVVTLFREASLPATLEYLPALTEELTALGVRDTHSDDLAFSLALALRSARPNPNAGERSGPLPICPKPRRP